MARLVSGLVTAIIDHICMLELVAADCAAAASVSSVPAGKGSGRNARID